MNSSFEAKTINGTIITAETTLAELLASLNLGDKPHETPTPKKLRETAGDPIAVEDWCMVYANGFCVYDNGSGRTVVWLPSCTSFTYHFDPLKDSEKGDEMKETAEIPEGMLETLPWYMAVMLVGDHRIESNLMNRTGSRTGTKDYDADDNGDKDGDAEKAMEQSYQREYSWREDRVGESPETIYIRKETREEMLGRMTDRQREVFLLYYRDGFNQREIAQMLGISQQKVSKRLSAALANAKRNFDNF